MLQGKRTRRIIAATLLTVMLTNTLAPTVTYALTSGPTAPEATSFEPVDTTDMVNLQTGDFTYNVPLLEVPGPEGGYPLSLSYHAGIQPNEDASWVGLGWTLNPGAITRNVNGYPDDYNGVNYVQRSYWEGGVTQSASIGVNIGITGTPASVSFGLSFSNDTYQGFGIGGSAGIGFSFSGGNSPFGLSAGVSVGPYGGVSAGVNLNYTYVPTQNMAMSLSGSLGINTNFESISVGGGVTVNTNGQSSSGKPMSHEVLGISLSSSNLKPSLSAGGGSASIYNGKAGNISSTSVGLNVPIPIAPGLALSLGYNYNRYWSDETETILTYGTLYTGGQNPSATNRAFDSYSLLDYPDKNIIDYPDPSKLQGGAFPEFDNYMVLGQGISGSIRPYLFQGELAGQSKQDGNNVDLVKYYAGAGASAINNVQPQFRFVNDFSNKYTQPADNFSTTSGLLSAALPFGQAQYGADGFDAARKKLAGSRNIEFFTNKQIKEEATAKNNGFIEPSNCLGFERNTTVTTTVRFPRPCGRGGTSMCVEEGTITDYSYADQIGGFSITNESGVTYHYGLPVYSKNEILFSEKVAGASGGYGSNTLNKFRPYAYAWMLTSITGPDFIDRNNDGKAGVDDWGYWVNFEYGKWTDNYNWRNPSEGYHRDVDPKFHNFSMGKKELYYLNAIRTRTHTALFEKNIRQDAMGESDNIFDYDVTNAKYPSAGGFDYARKVLRLDKVYLFNNADAAGVSPTAGTIPDNYSGNYANNVIDAYDVNATTRSTVESKAIRVIDFGYDYSACPGTPNSGGDMGGKLTLTYLNMRGKGGASTIPAMAFNYELSESEQKRGTINIGSGGAFTSSVPLNEGDLVITYDGTRKYLGLVSRNASGSLVLKGGIYAEGKSFSFRTTKNPPYDKDYYDEWGLYKGDFNELIADANENLGRKTTHASAIASDVWCLRSIVTSLGAEIKIAYEPDVYSKVVLQNTATAIVNLFSYDEANKLLTLTVQDDNDALPPLSSMFAPQDRLNFLAVQQVNSWEKHDVICMDNQTYRIRDFRGADGLEITSIDDNNKTITVKLESLKLPGDPEMTCGGAPVYHTFTNGNVFLKNNITNFGGGLRVQSLAINIQGFNRTTAYKYESTAKAGVSSGVTSFEPNVLETPPPISNTDTEKEYKKKLYSDINYLLTVARIAPPPGVMYEYVTVQNKVTNNGESERDVEGKTEYQFEIFTPDMIYRKPLNSSQNGDEYTKNLSFRSSVARIGNLKNVTRYDNKGRKLSETSSHYLHDDVTANNADDFYANYETKLSDYNQQGLIKERYSEIKEVKQDNSSNYNVLATMSSWEEYPNVAIGQTSKDYVTGNSVTTTNLGFDFYSGAVIKKLDVDAYGNRFVTETKPAYTITAYSAMGLKLNGGKNMLTQVAGNYVYKVDDQNNSKGLVSASVTTWSNNTPVIDVDGNSHTQSGVWRMQSSYNWQPVNKTIDGITDKTDFVDFSWASAGSSDPRWKKTSEITLYDVYSKALEAKDMNNNYAATRMDYGSKRVAVSGGPANYYEIAYSGAEDDGVNQANNAFVKIENGVVSALAHTGIKSLKLGVSGAKGFVYTVSADKLVPGRNYITSVWVKPASGSTSDVKLYYDVDNVMKGNSVSSGAPSTKIAGGWSLINLVIKGSDIVPGATLKVGCRNDDVAVEAYVDDFRFQPLNASTTAYVYDAFSGELTHILDNNNLYTKFEYDAAGRLVRTYREKVGYNELKTKEFQYNNSRCAGCMYTNEPQSKPFARQCTASRKGSQVTYTVPANTYFSAISVGDANQKAIDDIYSRGQIYANANGTCLFYNEEKSGTFTTTGCPCGTLPKSVTYTVPADKYSSEDNWKAAQDMAIADLNANGQQYAQDHGGCTALANDVKVTLVTNYPIGSYPTSFSVTFYCNGNQAGPSFTFPAGRSGRTDVYIPAGGYTLKFNVSPSSWNTFPGWSIDLSGGSGGHVSNPQESMSAGFSTGTNYTLTATTNL